MNSVVRIGVDPKWKSRWKDASMDGELASREKIVAYSNPKEINAYIETGVFSEDAKSVLDYSGFVPPRLPWENSYLKIYMWQYSNMHRSRFEAKGTAGENCWPIAAKAFLYSSLSSLSDLYIHALYPVRHGRVFKMLSHDEICYMALGFVLGQERQASTLARLLGVAWNKQNFIYQSELAVAHFMLRIACDWLEEPTLSSVRTTLGSDVFEELFRVWRTADAEALAPLVVAACDIHTHRCKPAKAPDQCYEFDNGNWTRTPIEILLLYRLREKLGLSNPIVDHPLMNTPLGKLPPPTIYEPDELLTRVIARMKHDGFDEQRVFDICYNRKQ
jgi:hypothetical protein